MKQDLALLINRKTNKLYLIDVKTNLVSYDYGEFTLLADAIERARDIMKKDHKRYNLIIREQ